MTDILAIGAHPDDIEFGCGGILAKMSAQKKSIVMVDMTGGEKGTHGTPELRREEGLEAARLINAERIVLDFPDCGVYDTYEGRLKLVKLIRQYKPKLVLAPVWKGEQTHPDHLACGQMMRFACRYARFSKILPEIPVHSVGGILHYIHPGYDQDIDFIIDVSEYFSIWKQMMACHKSQMNTFPYDEWNLKVASKYGVLIGTSHAQGLIKGNPVVIEDLMTISQLTREI